MTDEKSTSQASNIFLPSLMGLLLIVIAATTVWASQISPSAAEQTVSESTVREMPTPGKPSNSRNLLT
jgi:hypothetical protein